MMGKVKGVGNRILQQHPKALPFWCSSHLLNRCIVAACEVKEVRNMMGIADKCSRFFNDSSKRQTFLESELDQMENQSKRKKLKEMCRTRWVQRHDAFEVFLDFYPAVIGALNNILEMEKRPDAVADTSGILHAITTFHFVVTLIVVLRCLAYIKALSIVLQGRTLDVVEALKDVQNVRETLEEKRSNIDAFHRDLYTEAATVADNVGITPAVPRICGRQTARNNTPASSPEEYYKRTVTIPFLDHLLQQFHDRFSRLQERAAMALLLIPPVAADLDQASLDYFTEDLPSPGTLQADIDCWRRKWTGKQDCPSTLGAALKACNRNMFPNINTILRIAATFPVTSCECERSISTLGNVKTSCRSTMVQGRLTGLCLMSVHRDINVDVKKVVSEFSIRHPRKMKLPNILISDCEQDDTSQLWF